MTDAHHKLTRLRLSEAERTIAELQKLIDDIKDAQPQPEVATDDALGGATHLKSPPMAHNPL